MTFEIIIVDKRESVHQRLKTDFTPYAATIRVAYSGSSGLEMIQQRLPQFVIPGLVEDMSIEEFHLKARQFLQESAFLFLSEQDLRPKDAIYTLKSAVLMAMIDWKYPRSDYKLPLLVGTGIFQYDPRKKVAWAFGVPHPKISRLCFSMYTALVDNKGYLMSKKELMFIVYPENVFSGIKDSRLNDLFDRLREEFEPDASGRNGYCYFQKRHGGFILLEN